MIYGSVCSGIEAASVAWHPLGWRAAWLAEIESFPSAVLAHHYPTTPNLGDITAADFCERAKAHGSIDILVGGTPCQSFSVAGLRAGLDDPRGNLALVFLSIADRLRPRWVVWENVPGVLSSNGGRDFGAFLGGLGKLGYGFAYRVLDAQHFGVPQRRRRVFVVGYLGDWRRAAAVLFERDCLSGNPAPRRETGARVADSLTVGANQYSGFNREPVKSASSLSARGSYDRGDGSDNLIVGTIAAYGGNNTAGAINVATALNAHGGACGRLDFESETLLVSVANLQGGKGKADFAEGVCPARGADSQVHAIAFDTTQITSASNYSNPQPGNPCHPIAAGAHAPAVAFTNRGHETGASAETPRAGSHGALPMVAYAVAMRGRDGETQIEMREDGVMNALRTPSGGRNGEGIGAALVGNAVRRLTPRECERLQGFPDDFTAVPFRGKPAADGPRYRALGNSMAVPVMRWIGERIAAVETLALDFEAGAQ